MCDQDISAFPYIGNPISSGRCFAYTLESLLGFGLSVSSYGRGRTLEKAYQTDVFVRTRTLRPSPLKRVEVMSISPYTELKHLLSFPEELIFIRLDDVCRVPAFSRCPVSPSA